MPISDADTATLTKNFYTSLVGAQEPAISPAVALHHATRRLRAEHPDHPNPREYFLACETAKQLMNRIDEKFPAETEWARSA